MRVQLECPHCTEITEVPLAIAANRNPGGYGRRNPIICTDPECGEEIIVTAIMIDNMLIKAIETLESTILGVTSRGAQLNESLEISQLKVEL